MLRARITTIKTWEARRATILLTDQNNDRIIRICCSFFFIRNPFLIHACVKLPSIDWRTIVWYNTDATSFCEPAHPFFAARQIFGSASGGMLFTSKEECTQDDGMICQENINCQQCFHGLSISSEVLDSLQLLRVFPSNSFVFISCSAPASFTPLMAPKRNQEHGGACKKATGQWMRFKEGTSCAHLSPQRSKKVFHTNPENLGLDPHQPGQPDLPPGREGREERKRVEKAWKSVRGEEKEVWPKEGGKSRPGPQMWRKIVIRRWVSWRTIVSMQVSVNSVRCHCLGFHKRIYYLRVHKDVFLEQGQITKHGTLWKDQEEGRGHLQWELFIFAVKFDDRIRRS